MLEKIQKFSMSPKILLFKNKVVAIILNDEVPYYTIVM